MKTVQNIRASICDENVRYRVKTQKCKKK